MIIPTDYTVADLTKPEMKSIICSQVGERFLYLQSLQQSIKSGDIDATSELGKEFVDELLQTNFEKGRMRFAIRDNGQVVLVIEPLPNDETTN